MSDPRPRRSIKRELLDATLALDEARSIIYQMLPAVGQHQRGFSQEALIRGCFFVNSDPWGWTAHPDVLQRRLEILPQRYRKKFERRVS